MGGKGKAATLSTGTASITAITGGYNGDGGGVTGGTTTAGVQSRNGKAIITFISRN